MDLREFGRVVRVRWLSIILATLVGGGIALAYYETRPESFIATAQNFVAVGNADFGTEAGLASGSSYALQRMNSYVPVVDTPQVLEPVITELGLNYSTSELAAVVSAENPIATVLLNVSVRGADSKEVTRIADSVAKNYAEQIEVLETPEGATNKTVKVSTIVAARAVNASSSSLGATVGIGLIMGLFAGLVYATLRGVMDTSIRTIRGLADSTGHPALGVISHDSAAAREPLLALDQGAWRAEAFRVLRTNLQHTDLEDPPVVLAVASPMRQEGRTTMACNLAIVFAQAGRSVCLVDADLRRPDVHRLLGIEGSVGLTEVLAGARTLDEVLVPWNQNLLTVLPAGGTPVNPSELLSGHMRSIIDDLRSRFDTVILDAAPLMPVTDGAIVASTADGILLIARHGATTQAQAGAAVEALARVNARFLGAVLYAQPDDRRAQAAFAQWNGRGHGRHYGGVEERAPRIAGAPNVAPPTEIPDAHTRMSRTIPPTASTREYVHPGSDQ